mmetsp:Transcript_71890/g.224154  ORF Transcript_71890/g.224154 Transcript_71890/m.224154 type:complete len:204 (-) Transcript_71890:149-760(-)
MANLPSVSRWWHQLQPLAQKPPAGWPQRLLRPRWGWTTSALPPPAPPGKLQPRERHVPHAPASRPRRPRRGHAQVTRGTVACRTCTGGTCRSRRAASCRHRRGTGCRLEGSRRGSCRAVLRLPRPRGRGPSPCPCLCRLSRPCHPRLCPFPSRLCRPCPPCLPHPCPCPSASYRAASRLAPCHPPPSCSSRPRPSLPPQPSAV